MVRQVPGSRVGCFRCSRTRHKRAPSEPSGRRSQLSVNGRRGTRESAPAAAACAVLKLLRNVRQAYKRWRALPPHERERFKKDIQRILVLVRELGGVRAVRFVAEASAADELDTAAAIAPRKRAQIVSELRQVTTNLLREMARPARQLASDSVPRSARVAGKLAASVVKRKRRGR